MLQGYITHGKLPPPKDPTVGLCLGPYGGPRKGVISYDRGTSGVATRDALADRQLGVVAAVSDE